MSKLCFLFASSAWVIFIGGGPTTVFASACCGGGFAAPALIAGDDKAMLTGSYLYSQIKTDVYPDGVWSQRDFHESFETLRLEGARVFHDRWQGGFSLPIIKRGRSNRSSTGMGDFAGTLGYEYLPDWDYNPWRPKGLGYLHITAPTGRSVYEAEADDQLDARGRGFWAAGLGTLLTKTYGRWDLFCNLDAHRSLRSGNFAPGWGGHLELGVGHNITAWRFGGAINWTYEDPVKSRGPVYSEGSSERYATASLSAAYLYSEQWAGTLAYSDQSLFGDPVNARLAQSLTLQVQRRWSR